MEMEKIQYAFGLSTVISNSNRAISISTIKDNGKLYYADYYIFGQVIECLNIPEDIRDYVCIECEVKINRPRYNPVSGQFLGLYESIGYLVVRVDQNE